MAYEAIVGCHAMSTFQEIRDRALGKAKYAWELPSSELPERWRRSRLRPLVQPCLARDPAQRPTAAQLVESLARIGDMTSTT